MAMMMPAARIFRMVFEDNFDVLTSCKTTAQRMFPDDPSWLASVTCPDDDVYYGVQCKGMALLAFIDALNAAGHDRAMMAELIGGGGGAGAGAGADAGADAGGGGALAGADLTAGQQVWHQTKLLLTVVSHDAHGAVCTQYNRNGKECSVPARELLPLPEQASAEVVWMVVDHNLNAGSATPMAYVPLPLHTHPHIHTSTHTHTPTHRAACPLAAVFGRILPPLPLGVC